MHRRAFAIRTDCLAAFCALPRLNPSSARSCANSLAALDSAPPPPRSPLQPTEALAASSRRKASAETAALDWVLANSGPLHGDIHAGEFRIAFTITPAEGWWDKAGGGKLAWHEAPAYNVHLRIFVLDLADGRLVPGLHLRATLIDANGNEQAAPVDFGWYPLINAYGGNVPLDADSSYTLRVVIDKDATRHDGCDARATAVIRTTIAEFPPVPIAQNACHAASRWPPPAVSTANEAELLKPCNAALSAAITALWQQSVSGAEQPAGDYFVAYALDDSPRRAGLRMKNLFEFSGKDNVRLELLVRDSRTGRLIPGLKPQASLVAADGAVYGPGELPLDLAFLARPLRTQSPHSPQGSLQAAACHFDAPGFRRWGRQSERFAAPAEVEFDNLSLKPEDREPKVQIRRSKPEE